MFTVGRRGGGGGGDVREGVWRSGLGGRAWEGRS